jgi:hypothetical protein
MTNPAPPYIIYYITESTFDYKMFPVTHDAAVRCPRQHPFVYGNAVRSMVGIRLGTEL